MSRSLKKTQSKPKIESLENREVMSADVITSVTNHVFEDHQIETHSDQLPGYGSDDVDFAHNQLGLAGTGQTVVIIDSGIAYDHEALGGGYGSDYRVVGGWDFTENDGDPYDDGPEGFHGTHVAGIVGSSDSQYTGVAPGVDLVALRVFDDDGGGSFTAIEDALQWVHEHQNDFENPITTVNLSLGASYNGDDLPSWAMLENEFAQLERDGIFIAVSAGNSFSSYNEAGLSYPAVSEYVVPVASANSRGNLSSFSQRNSRVIVGPGESVRSTAPDYAGDNDGIGDDYRRASGTSMAAPYVAGASVLVREAWEISGRTDITQDQIYEHMRATADSVYDSATDAFYARLNLERALSQALPDDDFGDTADLAHDLGTIFTAESFSGLFTSVSDVDHFSFTAGRSGELRLNVDDTHYANTEIDFAGASDSDAKQVSLTVEEGQSYTFALNTRNGIGQFQVELAFEESTVDNPDAVQTLGVIDAQKLKNLSGNTNYQFTAANSARLTLTAEQVEGGRMTLLDAAGQVVATSDANENGTARVEIEATAGEAYAVQVEGVDVVGELSVTNLVSIDHGQIDLFATEADDRFVVRAGRNVQVTVHGETYQATSDYLSSVELHGGETSDQVWVFGTAGDDAALIDGTDARMVGRNYLLELSGSQRYSLIGNAGQDAVTILDTDHDDTFTSRREYALLTGGGLRHLASGFEMVMAHSNNGGADLAQLYDSDDNNEFRLSLDSGTMSHDDVEATAVGFSKIQAFATQGGNDTAELIGSDVAERFILRPDTGYLEGAGRRHLARGFREVDARGDVHDLAFVYDSDGDDQLTMTGDMAELRGTRFTLRVHEVASVGVIANAGGHDSAVLQDTDGDDRFIGIQDLTILEGSGFRHVAQGFDDITAMATEGGYDRAILYASPDGSDTLEGNETLQRLGNDTYSTLVASFEDTVVVQPAGLAASSHNASSHNASSHNDSSHNDSAENDSAENDSAATNGSGQSTPQAAFSFVAVVTLDSALERRIVTNEAATESIHAEDAPKENVAFDPSVTLPVVEADRAHSDDSLTTRRSEGISELASGVVEENSDDLATLAFEQM